MEFADRVRTYGAAVANQRWPSPLAEEVWKALETARRINEANQVWVEVVADHHLSQRGSATERVDNGLRRVTVPATMSPAPSPWTTTTRTAMMSNGTVTTVATI